jgi:hypothetical protein
MIEHQLAPHYSFTELVASIDAALDTATPLQLALQPAHQHFILTPDATIAIALVED